MGSELIHDNFLRVRTDAGVAGWVVNGAIVMQDKYITSFEDREIIDPYSVSPMGDFSRGWVSRLTVFCRCNCPNRSTSLKPFMRLMSAFPSRRWTLAQMQSTKPYNATEVNHV